MESSSYHIIRQGCGYNFIGDSKNHKSGQIMVTVIKTWVILWMWGQVYHSVGVKEKGVLLEVMKNIDGLPWIRVWSANSVSDKYEDAQLR